MHLMYGDEIRWRRENANMTQCELAEKVGVSQTAIAKYETSALSPNMTVAVKLAQILGTTCEELCGLGKYVKEDIADAVDHGKIGRRKK